MTKVPSTQLTIPIVLAVTGHRDIPAADLPTLKEAIATAIRELQRLYPDTPLVMLNGLAEGADQLAAEVAVELNVELGAVLPMSIKEYEQDFKDAAVLERFRELLSRSTWQVVVQPEDVTDPGNENQRDSCYAAVGHYLCRYGQQLIALWDGYDNGKTGGTAYVVKAFRQGYDGGLDVPDCGPVVHVRMRRQALPDYLPVDHKPGSWRTLFRGDYGPYDLDVAELADFEEKRWQEIFAAINAFNRYAKKVKPSAHQQSSAYLVGHTDFSSLPIERQQTTTIYATADLLSCAAQKRRTAIFKSMIATFTLAVLCEMLYSGPIAYWPLQAAALFSGIATFLLLFIVKKSRIEERTLDYRALAEALRVQHAWQLAGVNEQVADLFLRDQGDKLEWIRQALLTLSLPRSGETATLREEDEALSRIMNAKKIWIEDQRRYFLGQAQGKEANTGKYATTTKNEKRLNRVAVVFLTVATTLLIGTLIWDACALGHGMAWEEPAMEWAIVGYSLFLWLVPTVELYRRTMAYDETARSYLVIGQTYDRCRNKLDILFGHDTMPRCQKVAESRILIKKMGEKALKENGDWLMNHRDRPLQPPL